MQEKKIIARSDRYFKIDKKIIIIIGISLASLSFAACQKKAETPEPNKIQQTEITPKNDIDKLQFPPAPDGWIVTEKKVWVPVLNQIGENLKLARENYLKKDNQKAVSHIEKAVALLKAEESKATKKQTEKIEKAIADLDKLAAEMKAGKVSSVATIDPIFAEALKADITSKWVLVVEDKAYSIFTEISRHWQNAKKMLPTNKDAAASEIRKGTVFLEFEASRSQGKPQQEILAQVKELDEIAKQVQNGKIQDGAILERTFATANLTLAKFYIEKATNADASQELQKIGYELQAALKHLEAAREWQQGETQKLTTQEKQFSEMADRLVDGQKEESKAIKNAIAYVDREIKKLLK